MSAFNRPLRPKTHSNSDSLSPTRNSLPPVPLVSRAANTKQACNLCRHKKIKCDGRRPICSRCNRAGATCTYVVRRSTLQGLSDDLYGTIYDLLHSVPSSDVTELLETFRQELTQEALSSPNGELSIQPLLSGLLAPTGNTLEFELMTRHPVSYPQLFPLQLASLPLDSLLTPATWALRSSDDSSSSNQLLPQNIQSSSSLRPLADQRLQKLDISKWTKVVISNELAASIISLYIETDYRILPLFDLDLFIGDLVQHRSYFCSDLLVNCLLSWACQTYTAIDPKAHILSQAFFNEARNILPQGPGLNTLTAVSALTMLSIAAMGYGMDHLAFRFLREGLSIGMRMGLFDDGSAHKSATAWLGDHEDWSRCASYTAWGVHNWVSLYRLRYRNLEIDVMPKVPMPKKNPLSSDTEIFQACSELWLISNDIVKRFHNNSNSTYSAFSPKQGLTESMFRRLLAWADALPLRLVRSDQCNYSVLMMHIYFHVIVIDLFRYHMTTTRDNARLTSFSTLKATPRAAYAASINQLKRLLLMCRLSAETGRFSILSQTVLIYVCNAVVREAQNSHQLEWHLYLRLCLTALEDLYGCYQESWTVTQGLMSMAMKHGAMTPEEAQRITNEMIGLGQHHSAHGGVDTQSIVDLDLAITDPIAATGASLAGQFEEQVLQGQREEPASGDRSSMRNNCDNLM